MSEIRFDKKLGIRTGGLKEWPEDTLNYNRCEPTPYEVLEYLFNNYKLNKNDRLVDFGSGKGRAAFYIHNRFKIPVVGIEGQRDVFDEAIQNLQKYKMRARHITAPIHFEYGLAEDYQIKTGQNRFFFFNPFSAYIFEKILNKITASLKKNNREVHIILYYPMPNYEEIMLRHPDFELLDELVLPASPDPMDRILIYRSADN